MRRSYLLEVALCFIYALLPYDTDWRHKTEASLINSASQGAALPAFLCPAEHLVSAGFAAEELRLLSDPLLGAQLPPPGYGAEDVQLSLGHREGIHLVAGEVGAQVATLEVLICCAGLDAADLTVFENLV